MTALITGISLLVVGILAIVLNQVLQKKDQKTPVWVSALGGGGAVLIMASMVVLLIYFLG